MDNKYRMINRDNGDEYYDTIENLVNIAIEQKMYNISIGYYKKDNYKITHT